MRVLWLQWVYVLDNAQIQKSRFMKIYTKTIVVLVVQNFNTALKKSCLSHKLFIMFSSVAVSRQKVRSRVNKCFM